MDRKEQRGFEDLDCYKLALQVFKEAYRVAKALPVDEKYNLVSQLRRAATSVILNVAEGYGRYHYLDALRFFYFARGSLSETLAGFILCDEAKYTRSELAGQRELCHNAARALNGYIRYVRAQKQGKVEYGDKAIHEESVLNQKNIDQLDK